MAMSKGGSKKVANRKCAKAVSRAGHDVAVQRKNKVLSLRALYDALPAEEKEAITFEDVFQGACIASAAYNKMFKGDILMVLANKVGMCNRF